MKKYVVVPIAVSGKSNRIYKAGDIVTAEMFAAPVEQLVKTGFLKEVVDEKPAFEIPETFTVPEPTPIIELENKTPEAELINETPTKEVKKNVASKPSKK